MTQFHNSEIFIKYFGKLDNNKDALQFAATLDAALEKHHTKILDQREHILKNVDNGNFGDLEILKPTSGWKAKKYPQNAGLYKDTVLEMTGNALNRMGINAFNYINRESDVINPNKPSISYMCCGEDANGAQFESVCENIKHLRDLVCFEAKYSLQGKIYSQEAKKIPPFSFRPRGLHCIDAHVTRNQEPISGSVLDLALWAWFVLPEILKLKDVCPLLYIPKMQVVDEAVFWHQLIKKVEKHANLEEGTIKIVFLAETFPAVFRVARLIEAFEGRCIGVNCGRWDYLFSYQNVLANHQAVNLDGEKVKTSLPPKHLVTTNVDLLKKYQIRVAQICHHYGIQFIGGMNATLPSTNSDLAKRDQENTEILTKTRENKSQERTFYGASRTWVAHIGLLNVAQTLAKVSHATPIDKNVANVQVSRKELFRAPNDAYTITDFKHDLYVVLLYMTSYIKNRNGAVAIEGLMEDMATAEISSTLNWYYLKHNLLKKEIDQAGGLQAMVEDAAKQVAATVNASEILNMVKQVVFFLYKNNKERPSLEKTLYAMACLNDKKAFDAIVQSKRFSKNAQVAKLVQAVHNKRSKM